MDYRIAVCDDQQEARELAGEWAAEWAQSRGYIGEVESFASGDAFLFRYEEDKAWDILLLDVEMPGLSGVEVAKRLRREDRLAQIVFLTGYPDYIAEGYDVSALHYLLKPVDRQKLFSVLDRAAERLRRDGKSLLLELPEELVRVPLYEVEYLEVRGNYVTVHAGSGAYTVKKSLSSLERELDERFFRVGRSFVVNLGKVRRATKKEALLESGDAVPLPRGGYEALNRAILRAL